MKGLFCLCVLKRQDTLSSISAVLTPSGLGILSTFAKIIENYKTFVNIGLDLLALEIN